MSGKMDLWNQWEAAMNPNQLQHRPSSSTRICISSPSHPSAPSSSPPHLYSASSKHSPLLFACSSSSLRSGSPTPPTSPLGNQDANKFTITNNGGDMVPVQPFSSGEAVLTSIERVIPSHGGVSYSLISNV
ncbi:hypothetical protein BJ165DRAFT_1530737 [Panaeolus papilionaceus]|nr:hypothetical protein BJ165DRAFT_1530737 [Panaeolus papilionaceus]